MYKIILTDFDILTLDTKLKSHEKFTNLDTSQGFINVSKEVSDEELYDICVSVSESVYHNAITNELKAFLHESYGCFAGDEYKYICNRVMKRAFINELPGRIFVYLKVNKKVNPLGFYKFMCRDVSQAAHLAAMEEADRIIDLNERNEMIETLKYFTKMSIESVSKITLFAQPGKIEIKACVPNVSFEAEYARDDVDVLAELVTLNPEIIEIYGREDFIKNEISTVIEAVFEDRIQYRG